MILARCGKKSTVNISVRLPDGVTCRAGDILKCPSSCPYKRSTCARTETFPVRSVTETEGSAVRFLSYSEAEAAAFPGARAAHGSAPAKQTVPAPARAAEPAPTEHAAPATPAAPAQSGATSAEQTAKRYGALFAGSAPSPRTARAEEWLRAEGTYDRFVVGGKVFSDDDSVRRAVGAFPLKNALRELFDYWLVQAVFRSETELTDEFKWLLTSVSGRRIAKSDIDRILTGEGDIYRKFFYLFYDVVFRYDPPRGFYWNDRMMSTFPLSARFKDKRDFIVRYCEESQRGERFREFYCQHKREILHFLGCESEGRLFEDMTLVLAQEKRRIVLIDSVAAGRRPPVDLGTVEEFLYYMRVPSELSRMQNMVAFLEKYRISANGVSRRGPEAPFERSVAQSGGEALEEDISMYRAAKLVSASQYATDTEYDCYLSLLGEYVKVFSPNEITVGELHFTKNHYSEESAAAVFAFCKAHFGQVSEEDALALQGRAWLARSLFERRILTGFVCEDRARMKKTFSLLSEKNLTLENYYKSFPAPMFTFGRKDKTVHEYLEDIVESEDARTACSEMKNDPRIAAYFSVKVRGDFEGRLREVSAQYQEQYEAFLSERGEA